MKEEVIQADVLCIGGGIAGLMAAIRASELGARVIVAEKANTLRSGAGGMGNDHFQCYIPEYHGPEIESLVNEVRSGVAGNKPAGMVRAWLEKSFDIVRMWDSWGIPMKYDGKWHFAGQTFPGKTFTFLKYSGQQQKPILTREARKRGVEIINRVMVFDLLRDESGVTGAVGADTREDKLIIFQTPTVILGTGKCVRLYPSPTPGWMFNRSFSPATTGDGRSMALRAGAELVNADLLQRWAGPKYFARCGKGSWVGVVRDPRDEPVGPFVGAPDKAYGDPMANAYTSVFEDYCKSGKGPVYMDCRGISGGDLEYMTYFLKHEGNQALLTNMREENIDFQRNAIEFMTYELSTRGGISSNEKGETSVKGLYAAGDECSGVAPGVSGAAVFGWIAGDNAARYSREVKDSGPDSPGLRGIIDEKKALASRLRSRESGIAWQEANAAVEQIMNDYAGLVRSGPVLVAGLTYLERVKKKAGESMMARNPHELVHCLEVLNLLDMGATIFTAALERKETRGNFVRADYPFTNPTLANKTIVSTKKGDGITAEWRQIVR